MNHYQEAKRLIDLSLDGDGYSYEERILLAQQAQVYATLATIQGEK